MFFWSEKKCSRPSAPFDHFQLLGLALVHRNFDKEKLTASSLLSFLFRFSECTSTLVREKRQQCAQRSPPRQRGKGAGEILFEEASTFASGGGIACWQKKQAAESQGLASPTNRTATSFRTLGASSVSLVLAASLLALSMRPD